MGQAAGKQAYKHRAEQKLVSEAGPQAAAQQACDATAIELNTHTHIHDIIHTHRHTDIHTDCIHSLAAALTKDMKMPSNMRPCEQQHTEAATVHRTDESWMSQMQHELRMGPPHRSRCSDALHTLPQHRHLLFSFSSRRVYGNDQVVYGQDGARCTGEHVPYRRCLPS